jgi:potassium/chloride transporter 9
MEPQSEPLNKRHKLGVVSGVYIPVCKEASACVVVVESEGRLLTYVTGLNILSILMFLRFGLILGQVGLLGILGVYLYCLEDEDKTQRLTFMQD